MLSRSQQAADKRAKRNEAQLRKEAKEVAAKASAKAAKSRREAPAHALPPDYEGQIDLFVVLGVQRFGIDWPAIANQIKTTLTIERGLIDALPSFPSAAQCEERFRLATQHVTGDKMAALPGIIDDMVAKRLQTLATAHAKAQRPRR